MLMICSMFIDGMMEEVAYQVEHTLTASLPTPSGPSQAQPSSHWPSHVFSGTLGACITVLLGGRGAQPQV